MEKFAKRRKAFARFGLLVFVSFLFSQKIVAQNSRRAKIVADEIFSFEASEEFIFVNQSALFKLFVPQADVADVRMEIPVFPEGIVFLSSRSENFSSPENGRGVQIEMNLSFKDAGNFSLPPISFFIKGKKRSANFPCIQVLQDPQTVSPRTILVFENGETFFSDDSSPKKKSLALGIPSRFTLYVQYAAALGQVSWSLPKDSIFKELKLLEIPSDLKFSEKIPVAQFEWTVLSEGETFLPQVQIAAESYSGREMILEMPNCAVNVVSENLGSEKGARKNSAFNAEKIFEQAFAMEKDESEMSVESPAPDISALSKIARLRSRERNALFQNKIRAERVAAEKSAAIENAPNEKSFPLFVLLFSASTFFAACSLILFFLRKSNFAFVAATLAVLFAVFNFVFSSKILERHGIVSGGEIFPVPENSAVSRISVVVASRVLIREEIDNWYFIEYNESGGWIRKENLILIE